MDDSQAAAKLAIELSCYLRHNPFACDTREGIRAWWLSARHINETDLSQALDWLERAGVVASHRAADGRVRYRRADPNGDMDVLIERLIREAEGLV
jgi:hypothetical protein